MPIDWVRSGQTGKFGSQSCRKAPWAKYFPVRSSHSVNKHIVRSSHSVNKPTGFAYINPSGPASILLLCLHFFPTKWAMQVNTMKASFTIQKNLQKPSYWNQTTFIENNESHRYLIIILSTFSGPPTQSISTLHPTWRKKNRSEHEHEYWMNMSAYISLLSDACRRNE